MTDTLATIRPSSTLDVRTLQPRDRHALIFATLRDLAAGESFELVNDHDPIPLRAQLASDMDNTYTWKVLEAGPSAWRIAIGRAAAFETAPASKGCCGCCGGVGH